jgi:hypothetical protein
MVRIRVEEVFSMDGEGEKSKDEMRRALCARRMLDQHIVYQSDRCWRLHPGPETVEVRQALLLIDLREQCSRGAVGRVGRDGGRFCVAQA